MEFKSESVKDKLLVYIGGRLDATNADSFDQKLTDLIEENPSDILIDLSELTYISSIGLRGIIAAAKKLQQLNRELTLCAPLDHIKEIFNIAGFNQILKIYQTQAEALE